MATQQQKRIKTSYINYAKILLQEAINKNIDITLKTHEEYAAEYIKRRIAGEKSIANKIIDEEKHILQEYNKYINKEAAGGRYRYAGVDSHDEFRRIFADTRVRNKGESKIQQPKKAKFDMSKERQRHKFTKLKKQAERLKTDKAVIAEIYKQSVIVNYHDAKKILNALGWEVNDENIYKVTSGEDTWEEYIGVLVSQQWGKNHAVTYTYRRSVMQAFYAWLTEEGILDELVDREGYM